MWFFVLLVVVVFAWTNDHDEFRLISFSPYYREYVSKSKAQELKLAGVNYLDLTKHPEAKYSAPESGIVYPNEMKYQQEVNSLFDQISTDRISSTIDHLADKYSTRYYESEDGVESAHWIYSKLFSDFIDTLPESRKEIVSIEEYDHEDFPQKSVICTLYGSDTNADDQGLVIFGGHEDSMARDPLLAPGADDDASGIAAVFETFAILASDESFNPTRTLQFQSYAAEEAGLLGSSDIAYQFKAEDANVYAMINLDMCSYHLNETNKWVGIITDYTYPDLNSFMELVINTYTDMGYVEIQCGYACSDHASWNFFGYPSSFPGEAAGFVNPWIHTSNDTPDKVNTDMIVEYVKMCLGAAYELSMDDN